jgi:hypothetical protein
VNEPDIPAGSMKKAVKTGLLTFLGIRLWSSATLLLLNVFPADVTPTDEPARGMLALLEHGMCIEPPVFSPLVPMGYGPLSGYSPKWVFACFSYRLAADVFRTDTSAFIDRRSTYDGGRSGQ